MNAPRASVNPFIRRLLASGWPPKMNCANSENHFVLGNSPWEFRCCETLPSKIIGVLVRKMGGGRFLQQPEAKFEEIEKGECSHGKRQMEDGYQVIFPFRLMTVWKFTTDRQFAESDSCE